MQTQRYWRYLGGLVRAARPVGSIGVTLSTITSSMFGTLLGPLNVDCGVSDGKAVLIGALKFGHEWIEFGNLGNHVFGVVLRLVAEAPYGLSKGLYGPYSWITLLLGHLGAP